MRLFTQCACVLFDELPALELLEQALGSWSLAGRQLPAPGDDGWLACGPGFVVELRSGASLVIDAVGHPFPDDALTASESPALRAAWRTGMFGPTSAPGALGRAKRHAWVWKEGAGAADRHRGFVRLRTLVPLPENGELPDDHDPLHELTAVTEMAGDLLRVPGASALFVPAGESLRSRQQVEAALQRKSGVGPPPVELWLNLRSGGLGQDGDSRWVIVDIVGMGQLRLPDQEAVFVEGQEQAQAVAPLLRNVCLHLVAGKDIPEGSTADDARGRYWKASACTSVLPPDRPVLRWLPEEGEKLTEAMLSKLRAG